MKRILVLGGTRFFGRKLVELLVENGHDVTMITRGHSGNPFGNKVEHIIADRSNKEELAEKVDGRIFDVVYDNICYSPKEAYEFCEVFNGKINKLVFTSSMSVYEADGNEKSEADFDSYTYEVRMGAREDFTYGEAKRLAEATFFKYADFPVTAVRFPIVMGEDDYTHRLHFHIERILNEETIGFVNLQAEMSFIEATEAARFLMWAGKKSIEGPINATANGKIEMASLIHLIEKTVGKTAVISLNRNDDILSPYAISESWYMSNQKAVEEGFQFTYLENWLKPLIETIAKERLMQL